MAVDAPNAFAYPVNVPTELVAALHTGRADLVNLVQPRLLTLEEHRAYLDLIKYLIQTHYERMIYKAEFRQEVEDGESR